MGAATFTVATVDPEDVIRNRRVRRGTLTLSSSYATGGDSFDLATQVGFKQLHKILVDSASNPRGYSLELAGTASVPLLKCYATSGVEVTAATNQATLTLAVELHGI